MELRPDIKRALVDILFENKDIRMISSAGINISDIIIDSFPIVIIGNPDTESMKRFLFDEYEISLPLTIGYRATPETAHDIGIKLKDSVKATLKTDPLLKGTVSYSTVIRSKTETATNAPIYFKEIIIYINQRGK